jgi:cellulose synthase/poly-beta-1,6-N-acetylglucosamine synthase-like glycosyltransferase
MLILEFILHTVEIISFIYLGSTIIYLVVFAVAGHFTRKPVQTKQMTRRRFAVLIPAYKEDSIIYETAAEALRQKYPSALYDVIIIADSLKPETIIMLSELDVKTVVVSFKKSTKSKALNKAMETIGNDYDVAVILDADNVMEADFLKKINESFNKGYKVVQGHRTTKNLNTPLAVLDSVSEEINNHIFRKGHRGLGLSAALIGSGMAFDYHMFKQIMREMTAVGGFDKELEMMLLKNDVRIEYHSDAYVMDEKVQNSEVFVNQRRRWLSAQLIYFSKNIGPAIAQLIKRGRFDYLDKALQMGQLPRILLLGVVTILTFCYGIAGFILPSHTLLLNFNIWATLLTLLSMAMIISVPRRFFDRSTLVALTTLPKGFLLMMVSMLKIKGANEKFLHTSHNINTIQ